MTFVASANAVLYTGADAAFRRCRARLAADRSRRRGGGGHGTDAGDHPGRLRRPAGRLHRAPGDRRRGAGRAADDHRRRLALARRDVRAPAGRDAGRHDRAQPPSGQDHDDGRGWRGPDRPRRPGRRPAPLPQSRHRDRARRPPRLDLRDGRARLQLPADRYRGGTRQRAARAPRGVAGPAAPARGGLHGAAGRPSRRSSCRPSIRAPTRPGTSCSCGSGSTA